MKEQLNAIASRLHVLIPYSPQQATPFNFTVGAIYALRRAIELDYVSKQDPGRGLRMWDAAKEICQVLAEGGTLLGNEEWVAGYFFNDGIFRMAIAYEHLAREATGAGDNENFDIEKAKRLGFRNVWLQSWDLVRLEMNRLKHKTYKSVDGPKLTSDEAVQALDHLVEALDRKNWVPPSDAP